MRGERFEAATGRLVRVAVVDSGVNRKHPHIPSVFGGVAIDADGRQHPDYLDRLGHGTAVAATIVEKAPDIELYAVKVFEKELATGGDALVAAMDWAIEHQMQVINLSLGTSNPELEVQLQAVVERAISQNSIVVSAIEEGGTRWFPGSLSGVVRVALDWDCPRNEYRSVMASDGQTVFRASGFARPIPGVPLDRNLKGISFAVANLTGYLARVVEHHTETSIDEVVKILATNSATYTNQS